jgi:hypothetical protein
VYRCPKNIYCERKQGEEMGRGHIPLSGKMRKWRARDQKDSEGDHRRIESLYWYEIIL